MIEETKSNWQCVADMIKQKTPVVFSEKNKEIFFQKPLALLHLLSYYKFAAKMIGRQREVLLINCNEGISAYLLSQTCKKVHGISLTEEELFLAQSNFQAPNLQYSLLKDTTFNPNSYDAIVYFLKEEKLSSLLFEKILLSLQQYGILCIGFPPQYEGLLEKIKTSFSHLFFFSCFNEIVQITTEENSIDAYQIILACKKR